MYSHRMVSRIAALALVALFGCSKDSPQPAPKPDKPAASRPRPRLVPAVLVGTAARAGDRVCRTEGDNGWINVHYEGCYGKPGTRSQTATADKGLVPGETVAGRFPITVTDHDDPRLGGRRGKGEHRAHSVEIRASGKNVYFDADIPLSMYGIDVDCPK